MTLQPHITCFAWLLLFDSSGRHLSLQKLLHLTFQANLFRDPKSHFTKPNGVATHSLKSPDVKHRRISNYETDVFINKNKGEIKISMYKAKTW